MADQEEWIPPGDRHRVGRSVDTQFPTDDNKKNGKNQKESLAILPEAFHAYNPHVPLLTQLGLVCFGIILGTLLGISIHMIYILHTECPFYELTLDFINLFIAYPRPRHYHSP